MADVELLNFLKKSLGIIIRRLEETGVLATLASTDHVFMPEIEVPPMGIAIPVEGFLYSIRVHPDSAPVKVNFDRPVTDREYTVVFPGTIKKVGRLTKALYMVAPLGHTSKVDLEVLKVG